MDIDHELTQSLNDWSNEFVKIKYLQGEYRRKHEGKVKEIREMEDQLAECRTELATMITSISLQHQEIVQIHNELNLLYEKETALSRAKSRSKLLSPKTMNDFNKSIAFKSTIQDHVQQAHDHIYAI
ncbi:hypothetical protein IEQ34_021280 [Dendrobium chrysotoxum]|uniref:Uncharacterized protein n=1 Tax=Dendrobium chrysotoxum TaxID=161865 RepID=A0AAV7G5G1_DENCH|nr:hypothetical protein IEQ34_021280 [Dendrobium chrysotoxum]